ncbi:hypothetical protein BC628DRAFT_1379551, partial [Trametes gibbosa]
MVETTSCDVTMHGLSHFLPPIVDRAALQTRIFSSQCSTSDQELLALRALWNSRQPINKLPMELLVDVLMNLPTNPGAEGTEKPTNSAQWHKAMAVCRHWRAVVVSTPSFWRTINTGQLSRWLGLALSRTGQANLCLMFRSTPVLVQALPLLVPQRHRIERLEFTCSTASAVGKLGPLISVPLPSMEEFTMCGQEGPPSLDPSDAEIFDFQPENFPALVKLKLTRVNLSWTGTLPSRLRTLDLRGCSIRPSSSSFDALLGTLRSGHNLEELTLHDFMSATCSSLDPPSDQVRISCTLVTLPRLRKLEVSDAPSWIAQFLSHVNLPTQGKVSLTGLFDVADLDGSSLSHSCLLPQNPDVLTFLRLATGATLIMMDNLYGIACTTPAPLSVSFLLRARSPRALWMQRLDAGLKHFTTLLRAAPLSVLDVQCDLARVASEVLDAALDAFPLLRSLGIASSVFGPDPFPTRLCGSLCTHAPLGEGAAEGTDAEKRAPQSRVRCPALETLRLHRVRWEDGAFVGALAECLREREQRDAPRLGRLEISTSRSAEVDWRDVDTRISGILAPMVDVYEFSPTAW